jgi:hypothetical protein
MLLLLGAFTIFAANSTILRDSALTIAESPALTAARSAAAAATAALGSSPQDVLVQAKSKKANAELAWLESNAGLPAGSFSLGRTQMALWLALSTAGFIFLWLTLGLYLHVITAGILVLLGINGATGLAASVLDDKSAPRKESKSFLMDLISDGEGPKLQRIQVVIWTCVLAAIFVWNIVWNFVLVDFDTNLLLLMGIANAMYLGFKPGEKQ